MLETGIFCLLQKVIGCWAEVGFERGDATFGLVVEAAGFLSVWYHWSQLEFGPEAPEVRLALLADYAGAACVFGLALAHVADVGAAVAATPALLAYSAELKGSIGEGPNHSNHSNHSNSFKIGIFRIFSLENSKISENFNIF